MASELNIQFLGKIPLDPKVVKSGEEGRPFVLEREFNSAKISMEKYFNERKEAIQK